MNYELDQKVIYNNQEAIIFDYNIRYKEYTLLIGNKRIYNVKPEEIRPVK